MTPMGEYSWKLVSGFLWTSPHAPFPLGDYTLHLFAVINPSGKDNYMLSPVSPSESSKWVILGTPT